MIGKCLGNLRSNIASKSINTFSSQLPSSSQLSPSYLRLYTSQPHPNPILNRAPGPETLANVGRIKANGTTGRFFKHAKVVRGLDGYQVEIDGFPITSKAGNKLLFPTEELAVAVTIDWESMHKRVDPRRMPLYTLCSLASDVRGDIRNVHRKNLSKVLPTDSLGARQELPPPALKELYIFHNHIINWFQKEFDLEYTVQDGNINVKQSRRFVRSMERGIYSLDDWALTGFMTSVDNTHSILTSLALWNGVITPEEAAYASMGDSVVSSEAWEEIPGQTDVKRLNLLMDIHSSNFFLRALPSPVFNGEWLKSLPPHHVVMEASKTPTIVPPNVQAFIKQMEEGGLESAINIIPDEVVSKEGDQS